MGPVRYGCLIAIVMMTRYVFWVILISCFMLLFKEIANSVCEYDRIKKRRNR